MTSCPDCPRLYGDGQADPRTKVRERCCIDVQKDKEREERAYGRAPSNIMELPPQRPLESPLNRKARRRAEALLGGQHVGRGQVPAQLLGDEEGGLGPVGMALDGGADAVDEGAQPGRADLGRGHAFQLAGDRLIRPMPTFVLIHR